jgi:hypothetical protein
MLQLIETLWSVLVGNVALLINVIVTVLSVIFGGGTAILNIVLQAVSDLCSIFIWDIDTTFILSLVDID